MPQFLQESWFFTWELFKFMIFFYSVWLPGFLVAGLLTCRFRYQTWSAVTANTKVSFTGLVQTVAGGVVGSVGRKTSINAMLDLLKRGVPVPLTLVFLIANRNMTIHFWAIFALSLGAEFATGQVLGALVMIGIVSLCLSWLNIDFVGVSILEKPQGNSSSFEFPKFLSWRALLLSLAGWSAILKFIGREVKRFAPSLAVGILLAGIIFAAGLRPGWPAFGAVFGQATLASDLVNALVGAALSPLVSLSPVGNLPVVHALFKTDGLGYPGIISFCLASVIHRSDIKSYMSAFGQRQAWSLVGILYGAAVLGGLGSTWVYAAFGFRPSLPPVKLASKLLRAFLSYLSGAGF
jgi:uncharacterized membrane protein YraQ (UPF0718 family)